MNLKKLTLIFSLILNSTITFATTIEVFEEIANFNNNPQYQSFKKMVSGVYLENKRIQVYTVESPTDIKLEFAVCLISESVAKEAGLSLGELFQILNIDSKDSSAVEMAHADPGGSGTGIGSAIGRNKDLNLKCFAKTSSFKGTTAKKILNVEAERISIERKKQ